MDKYFTKRRISGIVFLLFSIINAILIQFILKNAEVKKILELITWLFLYISVDRIFFEKGKTLRIIISLRGTALKLMKYIQKKISIASIRGKTNEKFIKGYKDFSDKIDGAYKYKKRKKKHKKYKLMSNKEKIRFQYEKRLLYSIKKGFQFKSFLTPNEVGKELKENKNIKKDSGELIKIYNKVRYDDKSDIDNETVKSVENMGGQGKTTML